MMHSVSLPKFPANAPRPEFHINVVIGAAVIAQAAFALIWAGAASERLAQLERQADANAAMIERTARLEEQMRFISDMLIRIERKLSDQEKEA